MKRFDGKVAVVTGGNSGIGLAAAKALAREGASVVITGRDVASLKAAEKEVGGGAMAMRADGSRLRDIDAAMGAIRERFHRIVALFVNVGIGKFAPVYQVTEEFFDKTVAVNLKGVFFTVQKARRSSPHRPPSSSTPRSTPTRECRARRSTAPRRPQSSTWPRRSRPISSSAACD